MSKVAKIAGAIGLIALAATGVGAVLASSAAFAIFGGGIGAGALAAAGTIASGLLATTGLTALARNLSGGKKAGAGASGGYRSTVNLDPNKPQWIVIGQTAMPTQLLYFGTSGANNENLSMIFCHAACVTSGFVSLSINNITTAFPTPTGAYAGVLAIQTADGTQTANPFTTVHGGVWGATDIGRGLTLSHFRWTYDQTKLVSGLPQNIQFVGKGLACYDPRFDSTRGGSGTMRAETPSTWAYTYSGYDVGRNNACVELSYRLGFVKNGRVFAGMGEDPANIDFASYIASANVCDETVNGKPRYRIDGLISIGPEATHNANLGQIHASCGGKTIDVGGLIGFWVAHDDTASSVMTLTDDDWRGNINWQPLPEGEVRNTARGTFIDPASSYIAQPYGEIAPSDLRALDNGVELADQIDFGLVQDIDQARRLVNIRLRESRQGILTGPTAMRTLALNPQSVVTMAHARTGWTSPTFRVESLGIQLTQMNLRLRAVQASDYADIANTSVSTPGSLPTLGFIGIPGVLAFKDFADWTTEVSGTGKPADNATRNVNRGAWTGSTVYAVGDFVTYGTPQQTYICGTAHTSSGGSPPPNGSFSLFVAAGGPGAAGLDTLNVTASPTAMTVACSPVGAPNSGQLPRTVTIKVRLGGTDITGSCTITNTGSGCTITDSGSSYTVDAIAGDTAKVATAVTYGALAGAVTTQISKTRDGSPAISVQSTFGPTNSGSFVSAGELTLAVGVAGSGGTITLDASLDYDVASGFYVAAGKWQYRTTPGSGTYIDVAGAETVGSTADATVGGGGSLFVGDTMTGPTTPTNWEFKFLHRRYSGGTSPFGTGTMQASFAP